MVAAIGFVLSLSTLAALVTTSAPREARFGIFVPLLVMSIGWVQSRKKFCLAYGFAGTFNFGSTYFACRSATCLTNSNPGSTRCRQS
jgi:hypothetical protein